jgi:hypothetical protein
MRRIKRHGVFALGIIVIAALTICALLYSGHG